MMRVVKKLKSLTTRFVSDYAWRASVLLFVSILIDGALFAFYAGIFFTKERDLWYFFMACFYCTLTVSRIALHALYTRAAEREEREYGFEVTAGVSLCLIGLEICTLAAAAYADGTLITLSNATVITNALLAAITNGFLYNALHFVVKFIAPFTGLRRMHEKTVQSEFFRCKKYLNRAESLFMFMLLLNRILARRNTPIDATLLAVHLAAFLCTGIYAIASGAVLFFRAGRRRRAETE